MFRALLCASSGARDYDVDYDNGRFVLGLLYVGCEVQLGWSNIQQTKNDTTNVVINIIVASS